MKEKTQDRFAIFAILIALFLTLFLTIGSLLNATPEPPSDKTSYISTEYQNLLFDASFVHTIDIQIPEVSWDYMVKVAKDEQYVPCDLLIDGELIKGAAIRPKGNSSLSAIKIQGDDHFSFKIEFDHYRDAITYHGLDKLALNNLGQDVSCMKDFLAYQMMNEAGLPAPLTSYAQVTLNGEDFGLYLAVEAIEDSFAYRNYGDDYGNLYKPECFMIDKVTPSAFSKTKMDPELFTKDYSTLKKGERFDLLGAIVNSAFDAAFGDVMPVAAFRYVGGKEEDYQIFFDSSVFRLKKKDKTSFIEASRTLNSSDYRSAIEEDQLISYFLVHNLTNNYDGYTGTFVHNYYVREKDGKLSLIPWDYNLSCGVFTINSAMKSFLGEGSPYLPELKIGEAMDDGTSYVNYPIDTPTFTVKTEERPLLAAVLLDEELKNRYHEAYASFLSSFFDSGRFETLFSETREIITPYIEKGQTFYTTERTKKAMDNVHDYYVLRAESIKRQLEGSLPSTMEGQEKDYRNLVDGSALDLSSTVTFDSLVFGISANDVYSILDTISGEHAHNTEGLSESVEELKAEPKKLLPLVAAIIHNTKIINDALKNAIRGPVLLVLSIVLLCVFRKKVIHYKRRRTPKERRGNHD